jgi:formate hydrogenlyase subunit 3/multisubunit Na+/H+ antiporter MnhD subunit
VPAALLLLPVALLAVGALLAWAANAVAPGSGRLIAAIVAWGALAALIAIWVPQRTPLDLTVGELGAGIRFAIRIDAVSFAFGLFVLVPAALLLTFTRSPSPPLAILAAAASLFTLQAGGLILAAFGWGATLLAVAMLLQAAGEAKPMTTRLRDQAALLCLLWAGALIYARAGTDQYAAIPLSALQPQIFALVALASLLASGLAPWKSWPAALWERLRPETAGPATALLFFTGFYFLVRMYEAGGGHYPNPLFNTLFNTLLTGLGAACALAAALRAQAAPTRRAYLGETLPLAGGFALLALGLGTPLGIAAAIGTLAVAALLCALLPLVADQGLMGPVLAALVVSAGLPPTAVFGSRLLDIQAALEANEVAGYLGLAAVAAWVIGIAAAARAVRLGPRGETEATGSRFGALLLTVVLAVGGAGLGALQSTIAIPAAATVVNFPDSALTGGLYSTNAASGSWPAVALGGLLAVAVVALGVAGDRLGIASLPAVDPAPLFTPRWRSIPDRLGALVDALEIPAEFRVTGWQRLDLVLTRGSIWLWLLLFAALAVVVTR